MPALRVNTAPFHRACRFTVYGVGGPFKTFVVSPFSLRTMYAVGGLLKTTIVSPSPWNHCGLCRFSATAGCIWVLPWQHRILEHDFQHSARCVARQRIDVHASFYETPGNNFAFFYMNLDMDHVVGLVLLSCTRQCFQRSRQPRKSFFIIDTEIVAQQVASIGKSARAC